MILIISKKWSKTTLREPNPFCPYVYIHGIKDTELIDLKKEMISEEFKITDGFDFYGADFNPKSIITPANFNNKIKIKFINDLEYLSQITNISSKNKNIFQFYIKSTYLNLDHNAIKHIKIQVEKIKDIKNII